MKVVSVMQLQLAESLQRKVRDGSMTLPVVQDAAIPQYTGVAQHLDFAYHPLLSTKENTYTAWTKQCTK